MHTLHSRADISYQQTARLDSGQKRRGPTSQNITSQVMRPRPWRAVRRRPRLCPTSIIADKDSPFPQCRRRQGKQPLSTRRHRGSDKPFPTPVFLPIWGIRSPLAGACFPIRKPHLLRAPNPSPTKKRGPEKLRYRAGREKIPAFSRCAIRWSPRQTRASIHQNIPMMAHPGLVWGGQQPSDILETLVSIYPAT